MISFLQGDCREILKTLPDQSVHCCVTSPPYFGLRNYNVDGQIGLESSINEYVKIMVDVFREVKRVLRDDGTLWLNLGDSYAGSGKGGNPDYSPHQKQKTNRGSEQYVKSKRIERGSGRYGGGNIPAPDGLKPKDLIGVPWRVAFALQSDGWYLRQDIIWAKPNPMPESVRDRCTKAHEYIFLMSKSPRYYFDADAIAEPLAKTSVQRLSQNITDQKGSDRVPGKTNGTMKAVARKQYTKDQSGSGSNIVGHSGNTKPDGTPFDYVLTGKRNKRSVWTIATEPFKQSHFATFPAKLVEPCILAGCPLDGIVLDPFGGAGTVGLVADRLQREAILIELNPEYIEIAKKRVFNDAPMFCEVV